MKFSPANEIPRPQMLAGGVQIVSNGGVQFVSNGGVQVCFPRSGLFEVDCFEPGSEEWIEECGCAAGFVDGYYLFFLQRVF